MSAPKRPEPLTDEQQAIARAFITAWHDAKIGEAEQALAEAERVVAAAHCARAAWFGGDPIDYMDAVCIGAAAGQEFINEAMKIVHGKGGDRATADELRTRKTLVSRFLQETYGHDTSGKGAQ